MGKQYREEEKYVEWEKKTNTNTHTYAACTLTKCIDSYFSCVMHFGIHRVRERENRKRPKKRGEKNKAYTETQNREKE